MRKIEKENTWRTWNYRLFIEIVVCFVLCFFILLAGCQDTFNIPFLSQPTQFPISEATLPATSTPASDTGTSIVPEATRPGVPVIKIWVPPDFDPESDTGSGRLLKDRLRDFSSSHPGISIQVRVKATTGLGGMLDSLAATSAAAPDSMPSLVLLSRPNLETAASRGLIIPFRGLTNALNDSDWYPYARQLGTLQDNLFGLPMAGDALVLMYKPGLLSTPPTSWEITLRQNLPVLFPVSDPAAELTLALYLSDGGLVTNEEHQSSIEVETLTRVFELYSDGVGSGVFPAWMTPFSTDDQAWQAYRENKGCCMVSRSSRYLKELPADSLAVILPSMGEIAYTTADGWMWALSDPNPARREQVIELAEFLVESDFLAAWSEAAGYLPPRPSALAMWKNYSLQSFLNEVSLQSQVSPAYDILTSISPVLKDAAIEIFQQKGDPNTVARNAAELINQAQNK